MTYSGYYTITTTITTSAPTPVAPNITQVHLISTTDAAGHSVYSYYNEAGQLTAKVGAITQAGRSATTYRYDATGALLETHLWAKGAAFDDSNSFCSAAFRIALCGQGIVAALQPTLEKRCAGLPAAVDYRAVHVRSGRLAGFFGARAAVARDASGVAAMRG